VTGTPEPSAAPAHIVIDQVGLPHVPVLATLHAQCFALGWTEASFYQSMAATNVIAWLALLGPEREPVGFMVVRVVEDEAEILTLGVLRGHRRRGIARQLLAQATARASSAAAAALFLEVAEGNQAARGLYRKAGFHVVGRRANYYPSPDGSSEAAIVMRRDLRA
jgi:ribosomal-protein-alanine N-acetyltransferase